MVTVAVCDLKAEAYSSLTVYNWSRRQNHLEVLLEPALCPTDTVSESVGLGWAQGMCISHNPHMTLTPPLHDSLSHYNWLPHDSATYDIMGGN